SLLNRWIIDPGSNTHVANSKEHNWKTTALPGPDDYVHAGGQLLPGYSTVRNTLRLVKLRYGNLILLSYVAYIPELFTSVVSLSRCSTVGIHFDSGRDCLYQTEPSNVICLLKRTTGHWLIDAEASNRPP
ncbi:hypothetical protein BCR34DRAFT_468955, partial [Clohesyomyces aquaticus]